MTFEEIKALAIAVKDKRGVKLVKDVLRKHMGDGIHHPKLSDVLPEHYDAIGADLQALLGNKVMSYAYNSTVAMAEKPIVVNGAGIKNYMPGQPIEVIRPEVDTSSAQYESLTMKPIAVNRVIETREDAIEAVKQLQEAWDLVDDNAMLRQLMDKMEERHGEEFNAFFEATVRQIMLGSGMTELRIDTSGVLLSLASAAPMRVREVPGFLIYELVEEGDA